jgi:hypothetical protein
VTRLLQDEPGKDAGKLSRWFASRLDARYQVRRIFMADFPPLFNLPSPVNFPCRVRPIRVVSLNKPIIVRFKGKWIIRNLPMHHTERHLWAHAAGWCFGMNRRKSNEIT